MQPMDSEPEPEPEIVLGGAKSPEPERTTPFEHDQTMEPHNGEVPPLTDEEISRVIDGDAPGEVEADAVAELERIHQAQRYAVTPEPPPVGYDPAYGIGSGPSPAMRYEPVVSPTTSRQEDATLPTSRELYTLEDLYDAYPEIGGGSYVLRVVRKHPTNSGGVRCAGWIEDLQEQISMSEFASRFGGHVYEVSVRGPGQRNSSLDADGRIQVKTLTKIRLDVPGPPILQSSGADMSSNPQSLFGSYREDPRVQIKKLDLEAEQSRRREQRDERSRQEILGRSSLSPEIFAAVERAADKRGEEVRRAGKEIILSLRESNSRLNEQAQERDKEVQHLREELLKVRQDAMLQLKDEETRQIRELRERHNEEIRRMKEEHAASIQRMQTEHQRMVGDITERAQRDRDHTAKMDHMERDRQRDDAARREKNLIDEHSRRERELRETQEGRIKDIERSYDRELRSVRDMRDREIESIRSSETGKSKLTEKTAEIQASMLQGENARTSMELGSLRRENEDLRTKLNKPPMEAVREAHEIASMTGFKGEDDDFDWKRGAVSAIKGLIDKAPDIAKGFGDAREQNRVAVARAQQQAQMARMRAAHASRQRGMPQVAQGQVPMATPSATTQQGAPDHRPPPPPGVASPQAWDASHGPPEPGSATHLPDNAHFQPVSEPPEPSHHIGSYEPPSPTPPPISGGDHTAPVVAPELTQQPQVTPERSSQPPPTAPPGAASPQVTEEQVARFSEQLEMAISTGLVTPGQFAVQFVGEAGVEATRAIIGTIGPDQLVDAIQSSEGSEQTAIVTRAGRKYVTQLWQEANKIIGDDGGTSDGATQQDRADAQEG